MEPLTRAIDELLQLKGVTFEWKDPSKGGNDRQTGTQRGFIAQDVEKVFPEWVDKDGYVDRGGEHYRKLDLRQIEALEVESIRTLKEENDALKRRMEAMENGRPPMRAGLGGNGLGFAVGGIAIALAIVFSRGRRPEERA